jgi:hypothetical protein
MDVEIVIVCALSGTPGHACLCGEHPPLERRMAAAKMWMAGTSPAMTRARML